MLKLEVFLVKRCCEMRLWNRNGRSGSKSFSALDAEEIWSGDNGADQKMSRLEEALGILKDVEEGGLEFFGYNPAFGLLSS